MNDIDNFKRLIKKFDCCVEQLRFRDLIPVRGHWNLTISPTLKTFKLKTLDSKTPTHPLSLMLEGKPISVSIYGQHEYNVHDKSMIGHSKYPYFQLSRIFGFELDILPYSFYDGLLRGEDVIYDDNIRLIANNIGKYLSNKHFRTYFSLDNRFKYLYA